MAAFVGEIAGSNVGGAVGGTAVLVGDGCASGVETGGAVAGTAALAGGLSDGWLLDGNAWLLEGSAWQATRNKIAATGKTCAMKIRRCSSLLWKMLTASSEKYQQKGRL